MSAVVNDVRKDVVHVDLPLENYQHSSLTRVLSPVYTLMVTLLSVPQVNADQHCVFITN